MKIDFQQSDLMECLKEVVLLYSMDHPNIVPYKGSFFQQDKGLVIFITEYYECKFPILINF